MAVAGHNDEVLTTLIGELKLARRWGLGGLDQYETDGSPSWATPTLDLAAERVPGYHTRLARSAAARLLLEHEIGLITAAPCRAWLPPLFGLTGDTQGKLPSENRKIAARLAGIEPRDKHDYNRFTRPDGGIEHKALAVLAAQIVADCFQPQKEQVDRKQRKTRPTASRRTPVIDPIYVHRKALYDELLTAIGRGAGLITLVGEGGSGKTTLAENYITQMSPDNDVLVIRAGDYDSFKHSVREVMRDRELPLPSDVSEAQEAIYALLEDGSAAPSVVLIDNVADGQFLLSMVPSQTSSLIIATSREQLETAGRAVPIHVGGLEEGEAVRLVRCYLPHAGYKHARRLGWRLSFHALAVATSAMFIANSGLGMNIDQFCDWLEDVSLVDALDVVAQGKTERQLLRIYQVSTFT